MNDYRPPEELLELAARLADEGLDEEQYEKLHQIVENDRAGAGWFVEWMELHAMLHLDLASQAQYRFAPIPLLPQDGDFIARPSRSELQWGAPEPRATSVPWARTKVWLAAAVLGLVFVLGSMTPGFLRGSLSGADSNSTEPSESRGEPIATIAGGVDMEFGGGVSLGSRIGPGRLKLNRGVAQIVFDTGAVIVLEGPAELELVDPGACRLVSGSISADVMPDAGGFRVGVGDLFITESDARFGLRTAPQSDTEVHVFGGELNLVGFGGDDAHERRLAEGEAVRLHGSDLVTGINSDPTSFVTRQELAEHHRLCEQFAHARWAKYSKRWLSDPAVILRYEFTPSTDQVIANTVNADQYSAVCRQSSPRWIAGRWSDKQSMLFDGRTDVLDVADHPDLRLQRQMSLAVWFKVHSYSGGPWVRLVGKGHGADRNYGLWINEGGGLLWQACPDKDPESQAVWDRHSLQSGVVPLGQWQLAVGVVDGDEMRAYVNGRLRGTIAAPAKLATSDDPLTIGYFADIPNHNAHFCGEIDELILLNRVLSDQEIVAMYEAGRPEYVPVPGTPEYESLREEDLKRSI